MTFGIIVITNEIRCVICNRLSRMYMYVCVCTLTNAIYQLLTHFNNTRIQRNYSKW